MPSAVLAAVVLLIGLHLIDVLGLRRIASVRTGEFIVAAITAAAVVIVGVEDALIIAVVLSIIEHLYHAYKPFDTTLNINAKGELEAAAIGGGPIVQARPGLVIYRFGAGLYYANATRFLEESHAILEEADPPVEWLCLSAAAMGDIDYSGASAVRQLIDEVKRRGAKIMFCEVEPGVIKMPNQYGLVAQIDGVYGSAADVVAAYDARKAEPAPSNPAPTTAPAAG